MSTARALWLVFMVALALRAAYAIAMYLVAGAGGLESEDSSLYQSLAEMFVRHGDFVHPTPTGIEPETGRMPLYVIWLALHRGISGSGDPLFPALTQGVLDAFACLAIARMAGLFDRRLILAAGLVAACNPTQIVTSALILSDSVFFFFCCLALLAALTWLRQPGWRPAIMLGGALGLGLSVRAMLLPWAAFIAVLLPLLMLIIDSDARRGRTTVRHFGQMAVVMLLCLVVQAPIFARNRGTYGSSHLTSQGGPHSLLWIAPLVREAADGTPHEAGMLDNLARFEARHPEPAQNPFEQSAAMSGVAREALSELGGGAVAKAWLIGAALNLFSPAILVSPPVRALPRTGFFATPGDTKLAKIGNFLFANDNPLYAWIMLLTGLGAIALRLFEFVGLGLVGRARGSPRPRYVRCALAVLLLWAGYVLVVNGPIASAKYRLSVEPLAALGLAALILALWDWRRRRAGRPAAAPAGSR